MEKKKALGRGLQALIPITKSDHSSQGVDFVDVMDIVPNKYQPRVEFVQSKLDELVASIKERGVVQPLLVRSLGDGKFELIAGERRLRALKQIGIEKAPIIQKDVDDLGAAELALIENVQREGLNPMEEARAYKRLVDEFGFSQEKVSKSIGKDRSSVANTMRLLNLPLQVQRYVSKGDISAGHARAILVVNGLQQQLNLCARIIKKGMSVRETEAFVSTSAIRHTKAITQNNNDLLAQEEALQHALATKVRIKHGKKRGKVIIEYYSLEDLNRIIKKIDSRVIT